MIVGGQTGPRVLGMVIQRCNEMAIAILLGNIGLAISWITCRKLPL